MILVELHAFESGSARDEFVGELGLVVVATVAINLLVGITSFV